MELSRIGEELRNVLLSVPPDLNEAERLLRAETLSAQALMQIALAFIDACRWEEVADYTPYLYQVMELLLRHGLDPKEKRDGYELLSALLFVEHEYMAADTLGLLFAHGADPNYKPNDDEGAFEMLDFDIWFGALEQYKRGVYDAWLHSWMVFIGYGATVPEGKPPIEVFREYDSEELFDLRKLRQHRNYYCGLSFEGKDICVHVYDKETMWEVARL